MVDKLNVVGQGNITVIELFISVCITTFTFTTSNYMVIKREHTIGASSVQILI